MSISQIVVFFMFYSFIGWLWEMIYTPFEEKCFQNRGFLFGPICPIYGFSILFLQFLIHNVPVFSSESMTTLRLFFICMIGSAIIEFTTSWGMETLFHARWWDYSNFPLNINGRICLPASIFFGLAGVMLVRFLFPFVEIAASVIPSVVFETLALILMVIFGADYALTNASLTSLLDKIEGVNREFIERGESVYQAVASTPSQLKKRLSDYESETIDKVRSVAEGLNLPQKDLVSRITKFSSVLNIRFRTESDENEEKSETMNMGNRLKDYLMSLREKR